MINVICVGKKSNFDNEIKEFEKRLNKHFKISWIFIPYSKQSGNIARDEESQLILDKIDKNNTVILLDERGTIFDNNELVSKLRIDNNITIIIGGSFGVNQELRSRANILWSLGKLIFPHQIVRLILAEQIYRSQCIVNNHPYHHI